MQSNENKGLTESAFMRKVSKQLEESKKLIENQPKRKCNHANH